MATANKEDILLRQVINAALATKGSQFDYDELDDNFITIYNQLVALSQSSNIAAYDATMTYDNGRYVMYSNQLYKMIFTTAIVGVTPDSDPLKWEKVYATDLVTEPSGVKKFKVVVPSADVLAAGAGGTPIILVPKLGANKMIQIQTGAVTVDFEDGSPVNTPYDTNTTVYIGPESMDFAGGIRLFNVGNILEAEVVQTFPFVPVTSAYSPTDVGMAANEDIVAVIAGGNPLNGDSDIIISGTYVEIDIN